MVRRGRDHGLARACLCSDQDWRDILLVAAFVEVLEIQGVIVNLINCMGGEIVFTGLEFQHENHWADDCQDIDAFSKSGYAIFEVDCAARGKRCQLALQNRDLGHPCIALGSLHWEGAFLNKTTENHIGVVAEKAGYGVGVIRTIHGDWL